MSAEVRQREMEGVTDLFSSYISPAGSSGHCGGIRIGDRRCKGIFLNGIR